MGGWVSWGLLAPSAPPPASVSNGLTVMLLSWHYFESQLCVSFKCNTFEWTLWGLSAGFSLVFAVEMITKNYAYGPYRYWTDPLDAIDGLCVVLSILGIHSFARLVPVLKGQGPVGVQNMTPTTAKCNPPPPRNRGPGFPDSARFVSLIQLVARLNTRKRYFCVCRGGGSPGDNFFWCNLTVG